MIPQRLTDLRRLRHRPVGPSLQGGSVAIAVRDATRFDRSAISVRGGLLAAIPVVAALAIGTVAWSAVAGVTMGVGAMLVGMAWRIGGGRPPLAVLAVDAFAMALSTFVGCVTGSVSWLHLVVLFVWALMGGLLVSLGNRGAVVGNQAVVAAIVFGRFSQPAADSAALAGLVLAGGATQVLFLSLVRWSGALRGQRAAAARAYRELSELAGGSAETSALRAGAALDDAAAALSSLTLFGDPAVMTLRSLVDEGYRMRVGLGAIHVLMRRQPDRPGEDALVHAAGRTLAATAAALGLAARAIEGDRAASPALRRSVQDLSLEVDGLVPSEDGVAAPLARRLTALAGQLRAVAALAVASGENGDLRERRPRPPTGRLHELVAADLEQIRANATLQSPAGRHALRLAVVVVIAELVARQLPLQRGYWVVVAAAVTLRPEFGATFTRGTARALGACMGVGLAGALAVALHPAGGVTILLVGLLAWAAYAVFPASYAVGSAFITAMVVFLLNAISPDTLATARARLLDTLIGCAIGLLAYGLWPTWSKEPARQALADLLAAERKYLGAIVRPLIEGHRADDDEVRALSRHARLTRTTAESTVARSLSEPTTRRIGAEQSQAALAATRRLIQAAHVLRLDVQQARSPLPGLQPLGGALDELLASIETTLRGSADERAPGQHLPDLRGRYLTFKRSAPHALDAEGLLAELDEVVDAADSLASVVGLDTADTAEEAVTPSHGGRI
jgi:uncharacterized membrane protein YccC